MAAQGQEGLWLETIAVPYTATAKPGDVLRVGACTNPAGWWTVFRNDRPIHHLPDKADAEALCYAIANGQTLSKEPR